MSSGDIAFPHLGIYLRGVPKGFSIFGFEITWYGVIIGIGVACGFMVALRQAKKEKINTELIWDFLIYALIFSIIGARLYYVAFSWDNYKDDLLSIFNTREGGMAIYGGVIAGFLTCFIFTRVKKISFLRFVDVCVPGLIVGQIIGRWGNFMNREAFGGYSDSLLCMRLPLSAVRAGDVSAELAQRAVMEGADYIQVHPTFLYESLWNVGILLLMLIYRKHKRFQGEIALIYLGGYGIGRFFIEGLRTDQLTIGSTGIAVSQLLGILLFIGAVVTDIAVRAYLERKKQKETVL